MYVRFRSSAKTMLKQCLNTCLNMCLSRSFPRCFFSLCIYLYFFFFPEAMSEKERPDSENEKDLSEKFESNENWTLEENRGTSVLFCPLLNSQYISKI